MINEHRVKRNFSEDLSCPLCTHHTESLQHLFLSCPHAKFIWSCIFIPVTVRRSFTLIFGDWLTHNLQSKYEFQNGIRWCGIFATTLWFIWKWRCNSVFDSQIHSPLSPASMINQSYHGWFYANKSTSTPLSRNQVLLSWTPPPPDILKLNINGSRLCTTGYIAAGGLLRNCHGDWIGGFSANLGIGEISTAELWSLYYGLKLALQLNCNRIQVDSDSSLVVNLVKRQWDDTHSLHGLLSDCKKLLRGNWDCNTNLVYRKCNNVANGLARMSHSMDLGWHVLLNLPPNLLDRLAYDCNDRTWPRIVIV